MAWLFLALVLALFVGVAIYVRERRADQREAEQAREAAFLLDVTGGVAADADAPSARLAAGDDNVAEAVAPVPVAGAGRGYLDRSHAVVYRWLRTQLPDYEVFPRASLRRVAGRGRVGKDLMLDFALCNAALEVVAVVDLNGDAAGASVAAFKRDVLDEVGVKYALWDPRHLPDRQALIDWISA